MRIQVLQKVLAGVQFKKCVFPQRLISYEFLIKNTQTKLPSRTPNVIGRATYLAPRPRNRTTSPMRAEPNAHHLGLSITQPMGRPIAMRPARAPDSPAHPRLLVTFLGLLPSLPDRLSSNRGQSCPIPCRTPGPLRPSQGFRVNDPLSSLRHGWANRSLTTNTCIHILNCFCKTASQAAWPLSTTANKSTHLQPKCKFSRPVATFRQTNLIHVWGRRWYN